MTLRAAFSRLPPPQSDFEGRHDFGHRPQGAVTLADLAQNSNEQNSNDLSTLVARQAGQARGGDDKLGCAYLTGALAREAGMLFGGLWLRGWHLHAVDPGAVALTLRPVPWEEAGETGTSQVIDLTVDPAGVTAGSDDPAQLARAFVTLHEGLIVALARLTGLGAAAQWRLVADGLSGALLERGKSMDKVHQALAVGRAVLSNPTTRLWSRQGGYVEVTAPPDLSEWFRRRSGCCRYYTSEGGAYCTTCVLRDDVSQIGRLRDYMIGAAKAAHAG